MATYTSNIYAKDTQGKWGVYPVSVKGYVTVPAAATAKLTSGDYLNLCAIPANSMIASFILDIPIVEIGGPTTTMRLEDNGSATVSGTKPGSTTAYGASIIYVPDTVITAAVCAAGGIITTASIGSGLIGTSYDATRLLRLYVTATTT